MLHTHTHTHTHTHATENKDTDTQTHKHTQLLTAYPAGHELDSHLIIMVCAPNPDKTLAVSKPRDQLRRQRRRRAYEAHLGAQIQDTSFTELKIFAR
jgi:ABC-type Zn2+ transport system substrate-binding protein/surface adhesin